MSSRRIHFLVVVLALIGCGTGNGIFRKDGFYNERHPYRVVYPQGSELLADRGWVVDNYEHDDGEIGDEKTGPAYRSFVRVDHDEDGVPDADLTFPAYDLLLRNAKHAGRIWIRTLPIPPELQETELRVLALDFIDAVGRTGRVSAALGTEPGYDRRRLATRVLSGYPALLDEQRAYEVTFETADVDEVRFSDHGRYARTRLIVLRPDFTFHQDRSRFPVVMLIGYSNRAEDFARGNADFERLVAGLDILSEPELIQSRAAEIFECADDDMMSLAVYVDIDAVGRVEWADLRRERRSYFEQLPSVTCTQQALDDLRFRDKGHRRRLTVRVHRGQQASEARGYARLTPVVRTTPTPTTVSAK